MPTHERAILLLGELMQAGRDENPRGELYRTLSTEKLTAMLHQNVEELVLALKYDNDVEGKCADVANYVSFILHNYLEPAGQVPNGQG